MGDHCCYRSLISNVFCSCCLLFSFQWATEGIPATSTVPVQGTATATFDAEVAPVASDDWAATESGDWASAQPTPAAPQPSNDWGGSGAENWS